MSKLVSKTVLRLLDLRRVRRDRAESILRERQSALEDAIAGAEAARRTLRQWQEDRSHLENLFRHCLIGQWVLPTELARLRAAISFLHSRERLLEEQSCSALAEVDDAKTTRQEAHQLWREAYRRFDKCERLLSALDDGVQSEDEEMAEVGLYHAAQSKLRRSRRA
ncbi:YscO family type III secretion system apparatus protein [Bradyrhizobium sp. 62B]|uniref:type III secretion system stalk subunit SctO n=1 Tax=Bradyrhizobium sp. 62B TaxID=2898442 RepID=UPI0035D75546